MRRAAVAQWLRRNADEAERHVEQFCAESSVLGDAGILPELPRARDAASFLGVRVDWENGRQGTLHLSQALLLQLSALSGDGWLRLPAEYEAGLDFEWMTTLLAFDSWTASNDGPLHDSDEARLNDAPIPDFRSLTAWSKLRLARGLREGNLPRASIEVRHLAVLFESTGMWMGGVGAQDLLRLDRQAWEASGLPFMAGVVTVDQSARFRRVANAAPNFFWPGVSPEVRERALACSTTARCAAFSEALWLQVATRDVIGSDGIDWLSASVPPACDRGLMSRIAHGTPLPLQEALDLFNDNFGIAVSLVPDAGQ